MKVQICQVRQGCILACIKNQIIVDKPRLALAVLTHYFKELNDGKNNELLIQEILKKIKKKEKFKSKILNNSDQNYLFENISKVEYFKGKTKISDIAFLSK